MSDVVYRHHYHLLDLPGSARVTIFDGERTALIYVPGGQIEEVTVRVRTLTEHAPDAFKAAEEFQPRAIDAGPPAEANGPLVAAWLAEQAEDESLETAMMVGSLSASPFAALMAELIRRAGE